MNNNLDRFITASDKMYNTALSEIKNGKKESHWMWYIFPQMFGLGESEISVYYAIKNLDEAKQYMNNEILKNRLLEISNELLKINNKSSKDIFGSIDSVKLKSSMTLFELASDEKVFGDVLDKYFDGERDEVTLRMCDVHKKVI